MLSLVCSAFLVASCVHAQNGAWVPEPLPSITPPDVVNLFIQDAADGAGDFVASVIAADSTAATYRVNCNPATSRACGFAAWDNPIIMTQGPSTFQWSYAETANGGYTLSEFCTFNGTTASTAICTNSFNDNQGLITNARTTENPFETRTYDGRLGTEYGGYSVVDYQDSLWGPPPFIPVKITAGLASLSAFKAAAATTTAASSTSTSSSSSQAAASPTITSLAKETTSTTKLSTGSGASVSAGSVTIKGSTAQNLKARWELGAILAIMACIAS